MTKIRYADLTPTMRLHICNGCGKKGGWIKPPEFMFTASCNWHDFNYWLGCTEKDRKKADIQFLQAMKKDVSRLAWYRRPLAYLAAETYYLAVRTCGKSAFYYGKEERTLEDLKKELENKQSKPPVLCGCR